MGNTFTNTPAGLALPLSNGATDVLLSVLLLAGSDLAATAWEKELVTWLAEHDQALLGRGTIGFDVYEVAWTLSDLAREKAFLLRTVDLASQEHRWDVLCYRPALVHEHLARFRPLVEAVSAAHVRPAQTWECGCSHPWRLRGARATASTYTRAVACSATTSGKQARVHPVEPPFLTFKLRCLVCARPSPLRAASLSFDQITS